MAALTELLRLELRRRLRDPLSLAVWLAIPFLMVALMVAVFGPGGDASLPRVRMLVVDREQGFLSRLLTSAMDSPQLAEYLDLQVVEEERARRLMDRGKASLLVIIPDSFTRRFLDNQPLAIKLYRNPQESILPQIGEDIVTLLADAGGQLRAVLLPVTAGTVDLASDQPPSRAQVTELSNRIYTLMDDPTARNLLAVNAVPVVMRHEEEAATSVSDVVGWFAPGFVTMALLFLCNGLSHDIQEDLARGLLRRAWSFPSRPAVPLTARAIALVVAATLIALLLVAALVAVLGWRPRGVLWLPLLVPATAAAFTGLSLLLRSLTQNPEAGGAAASGIMVGLGFLGGCFMPVMFLPAFLRPIADLIPTGWAVQGFLILEGASWAGELGAMWPRIAALAITGLVTFLVAGWRMRAVELGR